MSKHLKAIWYFFCENYVEWRLWVRQLAFDAETFYLCYESDVYLILDQQTFFYLCSISSYLFYNKYLNTGC